MQRILKRGEGRSFSNRWGVMFLGLFIGLLGVPSPGQEGSLQEAEKILEEMVAVRELLSREKAAWKEERYWMERQKEIWRREQEELEQRLHEARLESQEEQEALEKVQEEIAELETERDRRWVLLREEGAALVEIIDSLPLRQPSAWEAPRRRLEGLSSETLEAAFSPGARAFIALLQEMDRWDGEWTRQREVIAKSGTDAGEREVDVLWMGLAHAFYRTLSGDEYGQGSIGEDGSWQWEPVSGSEAGAVEALFAIYGRERAPAWVRLPVKGGLEHAEE